jgi:3-dehydroquinate synthase
MLCDRFPLSVGARPLVASATRADRYRVHVVDVIPAAVDLVAAEVAGRRVALVTDTTVRRLHGDGLAAHLRQRGIDVRVAAIPPGEQSKRLDTAYRLIDWLASGDLRRRDLLLAVGGGVVCDTAGWVASAYMRGLPYLNVPTTLMAQTDAAIGGKVGVDHGEAKNLVGAFYQPVAVVSCLAYLSTLDARQRRNGLAEVVKKGVIASPELFEFVASQYRAVLDLQPDSLETLVRAASAVKCALVDRDPYERDLCRPLNFGHTVGHAVETATGYRPVLHGEAVSFGMAVAVRIARARGLLAPAVADRIVGLLAAIGLPVKRSQLAVPVSEDVLVDALDKVRQIRDGRLRFVLPVDLGAVLICDDVSAAEVCSALDAPVDTPLDAPVNEQVGGP